MHTVAATLAHEHTSTLQQMPSVLMGCQRRQDMLTICPALRTMRASHSTCLPASSAAQVRAACM